MSLPFSRIAILDPSVCFARPIPVLDRKGTEQETAIWTIKVLHNGADAVYVRHHQAGAQGEWMVNWLRGNTEMHVLLPSALRSGSPDTVGLHLRAFEERPPHKINRWWGRSCHNDSEVRQAEFWGCDYAFLSPVFPSKTHPERPALGIAAFDKVCQSATIPIFALGGITREREANCMAAGAAGIAAIRMFLR